MSDGRAKEVVAGIDVRVLGHGELVLEGAAVALSRAELLLLTALAMEPNRVASVGHAEDVLWPDARPATAHKPEAIDIVRFERNTAVALDRARPIADRLTAARDALDIWPGGGPSILEQIPRLWPEPIRWWTTAYQAATLAQIDGDLDTADAEIHRCFTIGQSVSASRNLAVCGSQLLGIRIDQGRTNELLGIIDAAVAAQPLMAWRCAMTIAAAQARDLDRSRQELEVICANDLSGLTHDIAWVGGMFAVASAVASTDDREHAELAYRHLAPFAGRISWQGTTTYGAVDYALSALAFTIGDREVARRHLRVANDLSRALRAPLHELRTIIALAACGDAAAAEEVDAALEEATRQGWLGVLNDAELVWRVR